MIKYITHKPVMIYSILSLITMILMPYSILPIVDHTALLNF